MPPLNLVWLIIRKQFGEVVALRALGMGIEVLRVGILHFFLSKVYMSVSMSVCLSIILSQPSIDLSINLSINLAINWTYNHLIYLPLCLSVCLIVCSLLFSVSLSLSLILFVYFQTHNHPKSTLTLSHTQMHFSQTGFSLFTIFLSSLISSCTRSETSCVGGCRRLLLYFNL